MFFWSMIICLTLVVIPSTPVSAAGTGFTTTITYQNVGMDVAHVAILYYPEGQTLPITISRPDLPVGASATISIGNLETTPASFRGSAVIKSDIEVAVLMTQIPTTVSIKARPMAGAASQGSPNLWLLPVSKATGQTALVSVQNLDSSAANIKFTFYGGTAPLIVNKNNIPTGGSAYIDLATSSDLAVGYMGGVFVESVRSGSSTPGKITGMFLNSLGTTTDANATESQTGTATKIYMPVAMCNYSGAMTTTYYVFNTDPSAAATVTVTYNTLKVQTQTLPSRTGRYFHGCAPKGTASGFYGSATITSNGPLILATGIIENMGLSATYMGQSSGAARLALPIANYSTAYFSNGQRVRTTISVMNTGSKLASGAVKAKFYGKDGTLIGTVPLPALGTGVRVDVFGSQLGTPGKEFGYYTDGSSGGSVIIEGPTGSSLVAVGVVMSVVSTGVYSGEAYNGLPPIGTP